MALLYERMWATQLFVLATYALCFAWLFEGYLRAKLTVIWATAASFLDEYKQQPRTYSKRKEGECTATLAERHALPCLPLRLHVTVPAASTRRSVPMSQPYMWYQKSTEETTWLETAQPEPS